MLSVTPPAQARLHRALDIDIEYMILRRAYCMTHELSKQLQDFSTPHSLANEIPFVRRKTRFSIHQHQDVLVPENNSTFSGYSQIQQANALSSSSRSWSTEFKHTSACKSSTHISHIQGTRPIHFRSVSGSIALISPYRTFPSYFQDLQLCITS